jgi:hypothetical protein
LFHEYFHGETGRGLGASHQTGWTALTAKLLENAVENPAGVADANGDDIIPPYPCDGRKLVGLSTAQWFRFEIIRARATFHGLGKKLSLTN